MADANTEGSRKRKSTSGDSTAENPQASGENQNVNNENADGDSFEPSPKCQKTSTNLENHLDTQTTSNAMKLNENVEENEAQSVENSCGTEGNNEETDAISESDVKVDVDISCAQVNEEIDPETLLNIENNEDNTLTTLKHTSKESTIQPESETISTSENLSNTSTNNEEQLETHSEMATVHVGNDSRKHAKSEKLNTSETPLNTSTNVEVKIETTPEAPLKQLDSIPDTLSNVTPNQLQTNSDISTEISLTPLGTSSPSMHMNDEDDTDMQKDENCDNSTLNENEGKDTCGFPPVITITFSNNDSINYKPAFLNFIQQFTDLSVVDLDNAIHLFKSESPEVKYGASRANRNKRKKKAKKELFIVDTNPTLKEQEMDKVKFSSKFKALDDEEEEELKIACPVGLSMCFNCDGNHAIKNCPLPKDFAKIRMARQKFKNNAAVKSARYHLEEEQKFAHIKPGRISSKLREALGLGKYEVPVHVYKMRVLGYPPGWLEEAKIVHSNINMFDIEGKYVKDKGGKRKHIDPDKIVNYPGFNVEMEHGVRDQAYLHGVPKYSQTHAKEAMIKFVNNMYITMEDNLETCDMDIDNSSDKEVPEESTQSRTSPTLTDLEIKKKQLLAELVGNNSSSGETEATPESKKEEVNNGEKISDENNGNSVPINQVKQSVTGTPIIKSASPYARLPKADNFMKDVSPVINFENLPNSTGKYEQMTGVLQKVRKTLKNIQEKT